VHQNNLSEDAKSMSKMLLKKKVSNVLITKKNEISPSQLTFIAQAKIQAFPKEKKKLMTFPMTKKKRKNPPPAYLHSPKRNPGIP
jgi:hypothetical protein